VVLAMLVAMLVVGVELLAASAASVALAAWLVESCHATAMVAALTEARLVAFPAGVQDGKLGVA